MGTVMSKTVAKAVLDALGIEIKGVRTFTLRLAMNEPVTITLGGTDIPAGPDGLIAAANVLAQYQLTEVDKPNAPMQTWVCADCGYCFRKEPMPEYLAPTCDGCDGTNTSLQGADDGA
jgi:hypothetical protein